MSPTPDTFKDIADRIRWAGLPLDLRRGPHRILIRSLMDSIRDAELAGEATERALHTGSTSPHRRLPNEERRIGR